MYKSLFECDLTYGERHDTVVVLGWYPLKRFVNETDKSLYGVAGNLFNPTHGVELLIRNLLFNNHVKNIVICSLTKEDYTNNPGKKLYEIIEKEYPDLWEKCWVFFCENPKELREAFKEISCASNDVIPTREQIIKEPMVTMETKVITGNIYSQVIRKATIELAYPEVVKQIHNHGRFIGNIQENINLNIVLTDEETDINRLVQSVDSKLESSLLGYIHDFLNGTQSEHSYSYGDRLLEKNQIQNVIDKLTEKPLTMAGMMSIWYPEDLIKGNSPCLTQIWVRASEDGKLDMTATFRSNDMFRAWQFNAYALRALQIQIADDLKMIPSVLTTVSFSAHIYKKDFEEIDKVLLDIEAKGKQYKKEIPFSVVGNFVISRPIYKETQPCILIEQFSNTGVFINKWELLQFSVRDIEFALKDISIVNPSIETEHLLYLFREIIECSYFKTNWRQS
jgi:thymidylate synthase